MCDQGDPHYLCPPSPLPEWHASQPLPLMYWVFCLLWDPSPPTIGCKVDGSLSGHLVCCAEILFLGYGCPVSCKSKGRGNASMSLKHPSWFAKTFDFTSMFERDCGLVAKLCLILHDPMDCSPPGSSVHGIFSMQEYWNRLPSPPMKEIWSTVFFYDVYNVFICYQY